jgi:2-polyprenyl-3-methyl-5-hydroxy-6-metoxy-1,4-benzoquinol methylase
MDAPELEEAAHRRALAGLARINRVSRAAGVMGRVILWKCRAEKLEKIRMLDVACGGGDVPAGAAMELSRAGVKVELTLMDKSSTALSQAAERARAAGVSCETVRGDALAGLPKSDFDFVANSLFLHHLSREETVAMLALMKAHAGRMVVVSDLRRSRMGWIAAWVGCHLLSRSQMVHHDGPASVAAAWTKREMSEMAREAGMENARIENRWPWRMLLMWERPHA